MWRWAHRRAHEEIRVDIQRVDHVELYVGDAQQMTFYLCGAFGFEVLGQGGTAGQRSVLLGHGDIRLLLTSGLRAGDPATSFVQRHGDGVAAIGLQASDAEEAFTEAVRLGARPVAEPRVWRRHDGSEMVTATVSGLGDVNHRFVQRHGGEAFLPGAAGVATPGPRGGGLLQTVDHLAVCVPAGELGTTVAYYERVFGFAQIFSERIEVGAQAMDSKVVQDPGGTVTLTILAPDPAGQPGQIDDFLSAHGGAGVQHIAFSTAEIAAAVTTFTRRGVRFLSTPPGYYDTIQQRMGTVSIPVDTLRACNILVDSDHWGEMFQIFTESVLVRRTLFFELIERHGALTFGSNNIRALYEAKEAERMQSAVRA
jgi:4-hydroxymandelate synthase